MADEISPVDSEFEDHKTDLTAWITSVESLPLHTTEKKVAERFVRDCKLLIEDLDNESFPSAADLCDYGDRKNSLEIQFDNISQNAS